MKIKITDFAKRHFDSKFGATKILDYTAEEFEQIIQNSITYKNTVGLVGVEFRGSIFKCLMGPDSNDSKDVCKVLIAEAKDLIDGYAPFCRLLPIKNFTNARVGSLPITLENYQYIRSGYSARTSLELPTFSRWLELPLGKPKAEWLMLVLYSKEQIDKEAKENLPPEVLCNAAACPDEFDAEWGIVAILGQDVNTEVPPTPITIMRNALGIKEGGSGVPIDKDRYLISVAFWEQNCILK